MARILVSAGDASGDAIAGALVRVLRARHPDWAFGGMAGPEMRAAGVERVADPAALAVGGFAELLPSTGAIVGAWRKMVRHAEARPPDLAVLVDAGGFHLPFARALRRRGARRILYYVPPQVWAWRSGRVRKLASRVDRIATILPNETDFYARHGVSIDPVGHPILDREVSARPTEAERTRARSGLGLDGSARVLGLFPGSRRNELVRHLPIQLDAARQLRARGGAFSGMRCLVVRAPTIDAVDFAERLAALAGDVPVDITDDPIRGIDACDVALAKPGTITLELALRDRPMVVTGRTSALSAAIARWSLEVEYFAMPNLILDAPLVPERLQAEARPDRLADALAPLFGGRDEPRGGAAAAQRAGFERVRRALGTPGASERAADLVETMLGTDRT